MISQILNDGTITDQQSEYVIALLQENPKLDIGTAIKKSKELFSKGTQNNSSSDTLYPEELDDFYDRASETINAVEKSQMNGLIEDFNESLEETIEFDGLTHGLPEMSERRLLVKRG